MKVFLIFLTATLLMLFNCSFIADLSANDDIVITFEEGWESDLLTGISEEKIAELQGQYFETELDLILELHKESLLSLPGVTNVLALELGGTPTIVVFHKEDGHFSAAEIPAVIAGYPVITEVDQAVETMLVQEEETLPVSGMVEEDEQASSDKSETIMYALMGMAMIAIFLLLSRKGS